VLIIDRIEKPSPAVLADAMTTPGRQAPTREQVAASAPKFDVVSVKPCAADAPGTPRARTGEASVPIASPGRLYLRCYSLAGLISEAYISFAGGRGNEFWVGLTISVEGGPDWMKTERYAIEATGDPAAPPAVMRGPMLQAVLEDRFKLKIRRESREAPIYELVAAKSGAKVSPYSGTDCVARDASIWPPPQPPTGKRFCGDQSRSEGDSYIRTGVITLDQLAAFLPFDRPVVNRTGITALVTLRLEYPKADAIFGGAPPPSLVAALRDQLGLDLRPSKGPRDVLIIDHAERPSPDDASFPATRHQ
jgi:uncharacterized protein (TIGR03435 family)